MLYSHDLMKIPQSFVENDDDYDFALELRPDDAYRFVNSISALY